MLTNNKPIRVTRTAASNNYCVPAALSALTGKSVVDVMPLIREYLGDQPITGLYYPIAIRVLRVLGYHVNQITYAEEISIQKLAKRLPSTNTYLVLTHIHALVIANGLIIDNAFPKGVKPENYPIRNARVEHVFEVSAWPRGVTK